MRIITNADDFGFDSETVKATIECLASGCLTGATIMPKMPATSEAMAYASTHPEFAFGVHLTFVADDLETPISPPELLPGLVGANGRFLNSQLVRLRALFGRLSPDEIEREMRAQLAFVADHGVRISHVDSHGHLHKFAVFRSALRKVLPRFDIHKVRNVQTIYLKRPWGSPTFWFGAVWRRHIVRHFRTTEHFYMPTSAFEESWVEPLLERLHGESIEVGVHPGYTQTWRDQERRAILDFAKRAKEKGHRLLTWNDL